jgi:hypothetical protein
LKVEGQRVTNPDGDGYVADAEAVAFAPTANNPATDVAAAIAVAETLGPGTGIDAVFVTELADLPAPVGGVITLDARRYAPQGTVSIGLNRLVMVAGTSLTGGVFASDGFSRSAGAVGPLVTVPAGAGNITIDKMRLVAPTGSTCLEVQGAGTNLFMSRCDIEGDVGTITATIVSIDGCSFVGWSSGLSVGSCVAFSMYHTSMRQTVGGTGAALDFTGTYSAGVDLISADFYCEAGGTGVTGLASDANLPGADARGRINTCAFTGAGTRLSGITNNDLKWTIANAVGVAGSLAAGSYGMSGNAAGTPTTGTAWTKILGTTTAGLERRFDATTTNRSEFLGLTDKLFRIDVELEAQSSSNGTAAEFGVSVNGVDPVEAVPLTLSISSPTSITFFVPPASELSAGDYVEIWCRDSGGGGATITVSGLRVLVSALATGT